MSLNELATLYEVRRCKLSLVVMSLEFVRVSIIALIARVCGAGFQVRRLAYVTGFCSSIIVAVMCGIQSCVEEWLPGSSLRD